MDYNIVDKYINFIRESYMDLCKIVFKSNCKKELCLAFIEKYITVRYYNETNYPGEKDFINRINKELLDLLDKLVLDDNLDDLKNKIPNNINSVSITSGASTPEFIVDEIIDYLENQ